jgi:type II secretory pathway component GspD/PulD (secretin)
VFRFALVRTLLIILALASGPASAAEHKVTLDVKDADVRDVLQSLKTQCAIKNMIIDKEVPASSATFYLRDVPCETAFKAVFRTFNLAAEPIENSVLRVSPGPR